MDDYARKMFSLAVHRLQVMRSYNTLIGNMREKLQILKIEAPFGFSDEIDLNTNLLVYVDSCIALLFFIKEQIGGDFVENNSLAHRILREWRNYNHHERYIPFDPRRRAVDGTVDFFLAPMLISNKDLRQRVFGSGETAVLSYVTLGDILDRHQHYIGEVLNKVEHFVVIELRKRNGDSSIVKFTNPYPIGEFALGGKETCSDDEFWNS